MTDLILFHYDLSPFSEKARVMLGYGGLSWRSVRVAEMPPRPVLETLTGGYRKIPVAQLGADIFCDSRTIAAEIAKLANKPELVLENQPAEVQDFVRSTDLEVFLACVIASSDGKMLRRMIRETSLWHTVKFLWDRINLGRKARVNAAKGKEAKTAVMQHVAGLEQRLENSAFLFGAEPCIADFSAYHGLWFAFDLAGKPWLRDYPATAEWMQRMAKFGHGNPEEFSAEAALEEARTAEPAPLPESQPHGLLGHQVRIAPSDYGQDPATGKLVCITDDRWIIARTSDAIGTVHVHFPSQGFSLSAS